VIVDSQAELLPFCLFVNRAFSTIVTLTLATLAICRADGPKVAIVPVISTSGEKWADLTARQISKSNEYLKDQFLKRGFSVVPDTEVTQAMGELKIDFTDEEQQKRATLFDLARKVKADFIIFGVITATDQKKQARVFYRDVEGRADVKVWLLDVLNEKPILSAKTFIGRSGGDRLSFDNKCSDRQIQAPSNAFRDALKDFFAGSPEKK